MMKFLPKLLLLVLLAFPVSVLIKGECWRDTKWGCMSRYDAKDSQLADLSRLAAKGGRPFSY